MGFYTSLKFYLATPPILTGTSLAAFAHQLVETKLFDFDGARTVQVKFGDAVDRDAEQSSWLEPVPGSPFISRLKSIAWDVDRQGNLPELLAALQSDDRRVYRAYISLGAAQEAVSLDLQTPRPDDEEMNLCLWASSIDVGPVHNSTLDEFSELVGWMSVSISGDGYLWPWRSEELIARAAAHPMLQQLIRVCRHEFPGDWAWGVSDG